MMYRFRCLDFSVIAKLTPAQITYLQEGLGKYDRERAKAHRRANRRGRRR